MRCINLNSFLNYLIRAANKSYPIELTNAIVTIAHVPLESLSMDILNLFSDRKETTRFIGDDWLRRLYNVISCLQHYHKTVLVQECIESIVFWVLITELTQHMYIRECLIHATAECTHGKHCEISVTLLLFLFINVYHGLLEICVVLTCHLLNKRPILLIEVTDLIPHRIQVAYHNLWDV